MVKSDWLQFYQSQLEVPLIVEYPNIMQLCAILDKSHLVSHNFSYEVSTIQDQLGKIAWQYTRKASKSNMSLM